MDAKVPIMVVLTTAVLLAGCGTRPLPSNQATSSSRSSSSTTALKSFIYKSQTAIIYLQWVTDRDGKLSGQTQEVYVTANNPNTPQTTSAKVSGFVNGDQVSVTVDNNGITYQGTIHENEVDLSGQDSNGALASFRFTTGTLQQYLQEASSFRTITATSQFNALTLQDVGNVQTAVSGYHDSSTNPKRYYPTFFAYGNSGQVTSTNQPTSSYAAEIDLNAIDENENTFGYQSISSPSWSIYLPSQPSGLYYGVTANGIVFATQIPPDVSPEDANMDLNKGFSGDGGWSQGTTQVYIGGNKPGVPRSITLSELEKMSMQNYVDSQHA